MGVVSSLCFFLTPYSKPMVFWIRAMAIQIPVRCQINAQSVQLAHYNVKHCLTSIYKKSCIFRVNRHYCLAPSNREMELRWQGSYLKEINKCLCLCLVALDSAV